MSTELERKAGFEAIADTALPETRNSQLATRNFLWEFLSGPYPTLISRLVLGVIFVLSGMTKLGVPAEFVISIESYEMSLPSWLVQVMAVGLPPLELALGVWLLVGLFTRFSAAVSGGLMVIFLIAMVQAALRGLDPNCGCVAGAEGNPLGNAMVRALGPIGDWLTSERVGVGSIARDVVFLLMALHLWFVPTVWGVDWLRGRGSGVGDQDSWPVEDEADMPDIDTDGESEQRAE